MNALRSRQEWTARTRVVMGIALAGALALTAHGVAGQQPQRAAQARPAQARAPYAPPRTPWGDPDLQGTYTNKDENNTPFERPKDMAGKKISDFGEAEMRALITSRLEAAARDARSIGGSAAEDTGAGPSHWYEHLDAVNAQPWLVIDPDDGMVPALVPAARERAAARQAARQGRGPSDSYTDRGLYDRCISRGVPDILRPIIYGASYDITQSPGYVAIRHEMIHETRVIPLDGRPQLPATIRAYMGDARGWWEGDTLVVRTTNIHPALLYRGAPGSNLTVTERYTPVNKDTISWTARMEDPTTWERPWSIRMPLKRDESQAIFEFGCHEGNRAIANIMSAARAEEARQAK